MQKWWTLAGMALLAWMLACGNPEKETASEPASGAEASAPADLGAPADVAAPPQDPVQRCLSLAAQQKWNEALDPCTQAAGQHPDDLRIKHAVQQARAAAGG